METTFPRLLKQHALERPTAAAMREKEYGIWQTYTWSDMHRMAAAFAAGLHQAGLQRNMHVVIVGVAAGILFVTGLVFLVRSIVA